MESSVVEHQPAAVEISWLHFTQHLCKLYSCVIVWDLMNSVTADHVNKVLKNTIAKI